LHARPPEPPRRPRRSGAHSPRRAPDGGARAREDCCQRPARAVAASSTVPQSRSPPPRRPPGSPPTSHGLPCLSITFHPAIGVTGPPCGLSLVIRVCWRPGPAAAAHVVLG